MNKSVEKYGFSNQVVSVVRPIIGAIEQNHLKEAENKIAELCLDVCEKIENRIIAPKQGDAYFTLIDLYITDNYPKLELRKEIKDMLFEGMILHDYGKEYGTSLSTMKMLAKSILGI